MKLRSIIHKNYFVFGTFIGLIFAWFLACALVGSPFLYKMLSVHDNNAYGALPLFAGALIAILIAFVMDKKTKAHTYLSSGLAAPVFIFFSGTVFGCFVNFALNGHFDYTSWFYKPLLLICYIGVPSAFLIGTFYFLILHKLKL